MPGCHVTDQQIRRFMTLKLTHPVLSLRPRLASAKLLDIDRRPIPLYLHKKRRLAAGAVQILSVIFSRPKCCPC